MISFVLQQQTNGGAERSKSRESVEAEGVRAILTSGEGAHTRKKLEEE